MPSSSGGGSASFSIGASSKQENLTFFFKGIVEIIAIADGGGNYIMKESLGNRCETPVGCVCAHRIGGVDNNNDPIYGPKRKKEFNAADTPNLQLFKNLIQPKSTLHNGHRVSNSRLCAMQLTWKLCSHLRLHHHSPPGRLMQMLQRPSGSGQVRRQK